ncbi:hypothetical protein Q5H93_06605 [Hymenobacter sp. ASUV-10]|uniref:Uncharacterized protein n=1 Tax=Hymenobacter aranciens TaxID=3063996 RepID=A0ABT9B890_9BACT|nr:hypothetical protein [Hymenobacter sp. ASUV-10]MDO7874397.1 hypothetical protein [Hymenobacter sp. ASUV-10]
MHKLLPTLLAAGAVLSAGSAPPAYRTYANARFGFRIDFPASFRVQPEPANGDGRRFVSADGRTVLSAYAGYNVLDEGMADDRRLARQGWQEKKATFSLDQLTGKGTGYVLSGRVQGDIFYQKTVLRSGVLSTFVWQYPAARKAAMDAVIQHTIQTWQPGTESNY